MNFGILLLIFLSVSTMGFCQSTKTKEQNDEIIIATKKNEKYNLTTIFYGELFRADENSEQEYKIIRRVVFRDDKNVEEVEYKPTGTIPAGNFYSTEIWSSDEEYLLLPIGKFEGFGIFEAKNALNNIKSNKYFDTLKVKSENSGWFWHDFEKWEDDSTFSFRAGLNGDMFAFKYNVAKSELYCYEGDCEKSDFGTTNKGKVKATKRGDIAPVKRY